MPCYMRDPIRQNPNFVGRSDIIAQIDSVLLQDDATSTAASGLRSFSLCGFGGIGKTQIAIFYAFERQKLFDAIF